MIWVCAMILCAGLGLCCLGYMIVLALDGISETLRQMLTSMKNDKLNPGLDLMSRASQLTSARFSNVMNNRLSDDQTPEPRKMPVRP